MVHCKHSNKSNKTARFVGHLLVLSQYRQSSSTLKFGFAIHKALAQTQAQRQEPPSEPNTQPWKQTASQPDIGKESAQTEAEKHTDTTMRTDNQKLCWPQCLVAANGVHKEIQLKNRRRSQDNTCWQETKHYSKQWISHKEFNGSLFFLKIHETAAFRGQGLPL